MANFDEKTIRETAYYIWKNNGCPADTSVKDWHDAIDLLERKDALATANKISAMYRNCTLIPDMKIRLNKAAAKNIPLLLVKTFGTTSSGGTKKTSKKSK